MKKVFMIGLSSGILFFGACNNNKDKAQETSEQTTEESTESTFKVRVPSEKSTGATGTYTAEGRTYTGEVTTETNEGLRNLYTVTCKGDMIQVIELRFKNEEVARKGGSFKPGSLVPGGGEDNEVGIMVGIGYKSAEASEGTITITGIGGKNIIEFTNVKLSIPDKSIIVSGKIPF